MQVATSQYALLGPGSRRTLAVLASGEMSEFSATEKSHAALLNELALLDPTERRDVAHGLRMVAEMLAV